MRWIVVVLIAILVALQYKLWFQDGGVHQVSVLKQQVAAQKTNNEELQKQNEQLRAEVYDLKNGADAAEEKARRELGMVKQNETYYQIVQEHPTQPQSY